MFCPYKNSYLQLPHEMNPMVVNKSVRRAMGKTQIDPHDEIPPAQRLESMQPSLYGPCVDVTRARLGFGRRGLRIINRDIHSEDSLVQLQALHTLLDQGISQYSAGMAIATRYYMCLLYANLFGRSLRIIMIELHFQVQISENAIFLIKLDVVYRLIDLMMDPDPIVQEKVTLILTHLATYYQGRKRILSQPVIIDHLMTLFMQERKEIRYAAALCLKTLTRHRCACEVIMKNDKIIENLLKMIKQDYAGIVLIHLHSLNNLSALDPTKPLKANAFNILMELLNNDDNRLVQAALDCLTQLCKHSVGQNLADTYDMTENLRPFLASDDLGVATSALGLMMYTTLSTKSKWRMKQSVDDLTKQMVVFCISNTVPVLQLRAMQVLINMCDVPDMKKHIKHYWEHTIKQGIKIKTFEQWDGTSEPIRKDINARHNYRSVYISNIESIKSDFGDGPKAMNVRSYLRRVRDKKAYLLKIINYRPSKD